ncbi:hypothetical protein, partial [Mesorhizobium sp. B2-6-7]|uniref:hypothetical protein n=1 Tax=Mesorhizobium sp. B2-6-7 TaxID=2589910 RepID=UPI0015E2F98F
TLINFGGGTLVLVDTFRHPENEVGRVAHDYQVLVKNGKGIVYNDYTQALRLGSERADFLSRLVSPDTVLALLTLVLVAAFLAFWGVFKEKTPEVLGVALTTVIGFWFGRQSRTTSNTK